MWTLNSTSIPRPTLARVGPALVAGLLLAGCASAQTRDARDLASDLVAQDTGAIAGLVVSDSLLPLVNVAVDVDDAPNAAFTDAEGRFFLRLVEPGAHVLTFFREDLHPATRTVTVEAGTVANVQVELTARPSDEPYLRVEHHAGFIGCTLTWRDPVTSPEGRAKAAMCAVLAVYGGATSLDNSYVIYAPEAFDDIGDVLGEASWVSTQALGRGLFINYWFRHPDVHMTPNDAWDVNWSAGPSPLRVHVPVERIHEVIEENAAPGTPECGDRCNLFVLLYSYPQTAPASPVDVGLAMDQKFDVYRSTSFHARLPPGYTALPDS